MFCGRPVYCRAQGNEKGSGCVAFPLGWVSSKIRTRVCMAFGSHVVISIVKNAWEYEQRISTGAHQLLFSGSR